jgi:hypothetical protein
LVFVVAGALKDQTVLVVGRGSGLARAIVLAALGERLGAVDHVVSTASARARGRLADLDRDAIRLSFDTKVIGPLMLAKHLAPRMNEGGSFVIFSGVAAAKIAVGTLGVAITNARRCTSTAGAADVTGVRWDRVSRDDVTRAIRDYDRLGSSEFFSAHGFGPTTTYDLIVDERRNFHDALTPAGPEFTLKLPGGSFARPGRRRCRRW